MLSRAKNGADQV